MAQPIVFPAGVPVIVQDNLQLNGVLTRPIARLELATELLPEPLELTDFRQHDAFHTVLSGTAGSDDLALVGGTFGTDTPSIQTGDVKAAGTVTRYARFRLRIRPEYQGGFTLVVTFNAGMKQNAAGTSAVIDLEAFKVGDSVVAGSDLCTTAEQSINVVSFAQKTFTINPTSLLPGDVLDCRVRITTVDGAGASPVIGCISAATAYFTSRG